MSTELSSIKIVFFPRSPLLKLSSESTDHDEKDSSGETNDEEEAVVWLDNDEDGGKDFTKDWCDEEDSDFLNLLQTTNVTASAAVGPISLENLDSLLSGESSNLAYFFLQNEIGLSEEAMWKITLEAGSVLGMTANTLRRKTDLLRRTMDLSATELRTLLVRQPTILHMSADKNLAPTILFLVRALDLSKEELRAIVVRFPCVLCYATSNLKSKINFFTKLMGFSPAECRRLLISEPKLLTAGVKTGLIPHMRFFLKDMEIPLEKLRTVVRKNPKVLLYSLEANLIPKLVFFFIMILRMEPSHISRMLLSFPQILDYNLDNHIVPIIRYLQHELGFSPIEVRQILLKFPRFVTYSLRRVKHLVGMLRFELGLQAADVKRVLYQAPQAVGLDEENLKEKVEFLRGTFLLSDDELRGVLAGMPTLLLCSIEKNLRPKAKYLKKSFALNGDLDELRETILAQPALLGYSLSKRIRPRLEKLLEIGGHPRAITIGITMKEEAFDEWLLGRKKRLEKNPSFDLLPRGEKKRKRKRKAKDKSSSLVLLRTKAIKKEEPPSDGRIVHWTRERQTRNR